MEFTSQICTAKEQSERLLALGLKKETADMYIELTYSYNFENNQSSEEWEPHPIPYSKLLEDGEKFNIPIYFKHIIPAWSLHRLIEMLPHEIFYEDSTLILGVFGDGVYYGDNEYGEVFKSFDGNLYECMIDCIEWLIKEGYFYKEYLGQ